MPHRHSKKRAASHLVRLIIGIFFVLGLSLLSRYHRSQDDRGKAISEQDSQLSIPVTPPPQSITQDTIQDVTDATQQLKSELTDNSSNQVLLQQKITQRKNAVKQLMQDDPGTALALSSEAKELQTLLPPTLQSQIETETQLEGELLVEHSDNFEKNESENYHTLITKDARINLNFVESAPVYESGTTVKASGLLLDNEMVVTQPINEGLEVIRPVAAAPLTASPFKVAVILINFQNNQAQPFSHDDVRNVTFSNTNSTGVNSFYQENSFGKFTLQGHLRTDGDIFGWYTLQMNSSVCNQYLWAQTANQLAAADGFKANNYKSIVYAFPTTPSCAWSGWGTYGGSPARAWINGTYNQFVVGHELGHNFGTNHASAYTCFDANDARVPISRNCISSEYGDPFDIMGAAYFYKHFNAFHKGQAKFLSNSNSKTVTTSGEYSISPIESPTSSAQTLVIPTSNYPIHGQQQYYYLEYRQPFGFDQFAPNDPVVKGLSIRLGTSFTSPNVEPSFLIDTVPETPIMTDAPLLVGKTFIDKAEGIKITTLSTDSTAAKVKVEFFPPECVRMKPKVELFPTESSAAAGETVQYSLRIENLDSSYCDESIFSIDGTLPSSLSQLPKSLSVSIEPGNYVYVTLNLSTAPTAVFGDYLVRETVSRTVEATPVSVTAVHRVTTNQPSPTPTCNSGLNGKKADFNKDGSVNLTDYTLLVREFLRNLPTYQADANCDGQVNLSDYSILVREFLR